MRCTRPQSQRGGPSGCGLPSWRRLCMATVRILGDDSTISRRLFIFFYGRFIDQHDGNVITNGIDAVAFDAFQAAAVGFQLDLCFACRAGKYLQQILTDCHSVEPFNSLRFSCIWECSKAMLLGRSSLSVLRSEEQGRAKRMDRGDFRLTTRALHWDRGRPARFEHRKV